MYGRSRIRFSLRHCCIHARVRCGKLFHAVDGKVWQHPTLRVGFFGALVIAQTQADLLKAIHALRALG